MTNLEFFEKENVPFAEVMRLFNRQKNKKAGSKSLAEFLAAEYSKPAFAARNIVVLQLTDEAKYNQWTKNVVIQIDEVCDTCYLCTCLTPDTNTPVGAKKYFSKSFIDDNCVFY